MRLLRKAGLIFFLFILSSCYETISKPTDLIDQEQMIQMLSDVYLYKQSVDIGGRMNEAKYDDINAYITQKYKVTPIQFKESYAYYFLDNDRSKKMFEEVKKNLQKKYDKINENKEQE
ncbi:MAG: DUF4296 domain-containing protein [Flavobacteriales bacterium]|nr:DUF4296 domain-containing protein [Flavobacteriales bacterium]